MQRARARVRVKHINVSWPVGRVWLTRRARMSTQRAGASVRRAGPARRVAPCRDACRMAGRFQHRRRAKTARAADSRVIPCTGHAQRVRSAPATASVNKHVSNRLHGTVHRMGLGLCVLKWVDPTENSKQRQSARRSVGGIVIIGPRRAPSRTARTGLHKRHARLGVFKWIAPCTSK